MYIPGLFLLFISLKGHLSYCHHFASIVCCMCLRSSVLETKIWIYCSESNSWKKKFIVYIVVLNNNLKNLLVGSVFMGVHHEDWVFTLQQSFSWFRTTRQIELYCTWQKCLNGSLHCVVFLVYCTFPLWNLTCFLIGWNCYMEVVSVWMIVLVWCQLSNFSAMSCREQVNFQWDNDDEVLCTRPTCLLGFL